MRLRKYLTEVEQIVAETIPLKTAIKYRRAWNPSRYQDIFMAFPATMRDKQGFRLYLPYEEQRAPIRVPYDLTQYLAKKDYTVSDYAAGLATKTGDKRQIKIGRLITDDPALLKRFMNDPQRALSKTAGKLVCISRHPYDIAGSSTDRGWSSCMNLAGGINRHYVMRDVEGGTIIAYLIRADDKNIKNPISRLLIKPFISNSDPDDVMLVTDKNQYGTHDAQFGEIVEEWLKDVNGPDKSGLYCIKPSLYNDGKAVKFAGRSLPTDASSPEERTRFIYEYLNSIDAAPYTLKRQDGDYILEDWTDIERFCRDNGDDTLEYLLDLYTDHSQLEAEGLSQQQVGDALGLLPENLLHKLCTRFAVPFVPANATNFSGMITALAEQREIADELLDAMQDNDNLIDILKDRINKYIDNGWRFQMYEVVLHVPQTGDDYDLDAPVELRINCNSMMRLVQNHMDDPNDEDGGGENDLWRLTGGSDRTWSSLDEDYDVSEWRGQYANEPLVDKHGDDLVFGSKRRPKLTFDKDGATAQQMADSYAAVLRGEVPTHIKSDQQPDFFESQMRKLINLIR